MRRAQKAKLDEQMRREKSDAAKASLLELISKEGSRVGESGG